MFEELLGMEPEDALKHLTRRLVDEQLLLPEAMTGADLARRRALGNVGAKIIREARRSLGLGEHLDALYRELVFFNHATVQGEADYESRPAEERDAPKPKPRQFDLSGFDAVLEALGAPAGQPRVASQLSSPSENPLGATPPAAKSAQPVAGMNASAHGASKVHTLRSLMQDYFGRTGKLTGSDNRANIERAVKMFEDLCPQVKTLAVMDIPLALWDQLYEFVQEIPHMRGQASPDNLVAFTRRKQAEGNDYPRLSVTTLNSNYLGAITRLVRHGNTRRFFTWQAPPLVISKSKRATRGKSRVPFSSEEITAITSCPVYTGSASRHRRYSPGSAIFADDHIYWAPLISMHSGMRVTEVGMLRPHQLQMWFGRPTLVLELEEGSSNDAGEEGYKTGNAVRRVAIHSQLIGIGLLDFWNRQVSLGHERLFPSWPEHIKGGRDGRPEVHFEADFFNAHRLQWGVPAHRKSKLTFHSFRGFFIQACHDARINPYTILKWVGHDDDTEARTSDVHRGYLNEDLTADEVGEIDKVKVPLGPVISFADWLKSRS
ncbi:site-specific integrase [Devosia sp. LC5]|uniref:site-specific integrase n=1 Tax=Devosia sp. LC5 TaxID=1502724 RepID=UPI0012684BC5|nr:site-specific integrase [Devosia sp. LC5]